ncbi:hypothetical protein NMG60_11034483 [Bertholletia excelsa]
MAAATELHPVSAQVIGNAFVRQYYNIQHQSPEFVYRFYQDTSKLGRPDDNGSMTITTTMQAINEKILSLNYGEFRVEIKSVDAQESYEGGVHVLVTGQFTGKDDIVKNFAQTFFLAPQEKGYFVLNDMFRYVEDIKHQNGSQSSSEDVVVPVTPDHDPSTPQMNHVSEPAIAAIEVNRQAPSLNDNGAVSVVEEEVPKAEVVDEAPDDSWVVVESNSKIEVPKKSYASIVMVMKQSGMPMSSHSRTPRRYVPKKQEQRLSLSQISSSADETLLASSDAVENAKDREGEAGGYSIYIKGLPMHATPGLLKDEFKKFGPIKDGGIQVRSYKQQGICFGFVEFEEATAVKKAIEASPITIGGRQAFIEEKRSTNSQVTNKGRFPTGKGFGFRREGTNGPANYGNNRVYRRRDLYGKVEFVNGGRNQGLLNRAADGAGRGTSDGGIAVNGTFNIEASQLPNTSEEAVIGDGELK